MISGHFENRIPDIRLDSGYQLYSRTYCIPYGCLPPVKKNTSFTVNIFFLHNNMLILLFFFVPVIDNQPARYPVFSDIRPGTRYNTGIGLCIWPDVRPAEFGASLYNANRCRISPFWMHKNNYRTRNTLIEIIKENYVKINGLTLYYICWFYTWFKKG